MHLSNGLGVSNRCLGISIFLIFSLTGITRRVGFGFASNETELHVVDIFVNGV